MDFNPSKPRIMHIDINSCFATIEQQANPALRGHPIAVGAYNSPSGCILAASIEAKQYGVKTGMRVIDGKRLCPSLYVVYPDTNKYRFVHSKMHEILDTYCSRVFPKSIDEFVLDFSNHALLKKQNITSVAREIKQKIREEIGEWMSVSVGISTNRQLAKVAAGIKKPDGLVEINKDNFLDIYKGLKLTDLNGVGVRYEARLNSVGIYTVIGLYNSPFHHLQTAFKSVNAHYWFTRLRGWEADLPAQAGAAEFATKSFGHSYSIPENLTHAEALKPILAKLVNKATSRMRKHGFSAHGVHVGVSLKGGGYIHHGERLGEPVFYTSEIFKNAYRILCKFKIPLPVHTLSVTCYDLFPGESLQLSVFEDLKKKRSLAETIDKVNNRFGNFVLMTANMLPAGSAVPDRIAFGRGGLSGISGQ